MPRSLKGHAQCESAHSRCSLNCGCETAYKCSALVISGMSSSKNIMSLSKGGDKSGWIMIYNCMSHFACRRTCIDCIYDLHSLTLNISLLVSGTDSKCHCQCGTEYNLAFATFCQMDVFPKAFLLCGPLLQLVRASY